MHQNFSTAPPGALPRAGGHRLRGGRRGLAETVQEEVGEDPGRDQR